MENCKNIEIGSIVTATMGRDKGKFFVVVGEEDEKHVRIANGDSRTIDKPKKKKLKHLEPKHKIAEDLKEKILSGRRIFDYEIRKSLEDMGYQPK